MDELTDLMPLTEREMDAMADLWKHGPTTLPDLREAEGIDQPYTSTLSVYQGLRDKGLVHVADQDGTAYLWDATYSELQIQEAMLQWVCQTAYRGNGDLLRAHSQATLTTT